MKINTKLILLTAIGLVLTSVVIGAMSVVQLNRTGQIAISQIETLGNENVKKIQSDGQKQLTAFREDVLTRKKEYLKSQVQTAIGVLEKGSKDAHDPEKLKAVYREQLQNAVNTAYSIIVAVSQEAGLSKAEQQSKAAGLVKKLRYGPENKDYFWINDMHPRMVMHPYKPQLDGKDLSASEDPNGKKLFVAMVKECRDNGQGFVDYHWPKYGAEEPQPKLSFVKLYKPWNWVIGSGVYMEVAEDKLMADSAEIISALRFGPESKDYFWINDMQPRMVMHPYKPQLNGKDLSGAKDPNGKHLFVEMVKVCREKGEGFVDYFWPKYGADQPQPKLSYVRLFEKWNWVIGTGVYIDDIEVMVTAKKEELGQRVKAATAETQHQIETTKGELQKKISSVLVWIGIITLAVLIVVLTLSYFYIQRSINRPITNAIEGLTAASDQVATASGEVSSASQSLAEGASEQAASIEETSSSLEEMSAMTKQNADNANQANTLMSEANQVVTRANESMAHLTTSMEDISNASEETSKIIKTIDEIAFQTNLLALNAAVEAARAGEAGAGFAVVADEVRNLAMRAADAAKNTSELIEDSVKKIKDGTELVNVTNEAFGEVAKSAGKVSELVDEIAAASNEQAQGIDQVNTAVTEMDKVTQQNAATAEESASASEEMNAQAMQMRSIVNELRSMVGGAVSNSKSKGKRHRRTQEVLSLPDISQRKKAGAQAKREVSSSSREVRPEHVIPLDDEDFKDF